MALLGVLGCIVVIVAVVAWRGVIERAANARIDAEVNRKRAESTQNETLTALDAKKAADDKRDPVDVANEMIAAAKKRGG